MTFGTAPHQETAWFLHLASCRFHGGEFGTPVQSEFFKQKIGKRFWNQVRTPRKLHRNEDMLKGASSLDDGGTELCRVLQVEEDRAILEALKKNSKMDKVGETIRRDEQKEERSGFASPRALLPFLA